VSKAAVHVACWLLQRRPKLAPARECLPWALFSFALFSFKIQNLKSVIVKFMAYAWRIKYR
jgi:hypothetical protein